MVPCFKDVNRLVMGNGDKALAVYFQYLVTHLQQTRELAEGVWLDKYNHRLNSEFVLC